MDDGRAGLAGQLAIGEIDRADITVTLPGGVPGVQCSVGYGAGRPCADLAITGDRVELSATNLPPRTPVTLRAGVDVPTPPRAEPVPDLLDRWAADYAAEHPNARHTFANTRSACSCAARRAGSSGTPGCG